MDLNKFLKYFGMLFVVIGMVAGILFIGGALMTRSWRFLRLDRRIRAEA